MYGLQVLILCRSGLDFAPCWTAKGPIAAIRGIATNNDGYTKESITFPSSVAQTKLARQVHTSLREKETDCYSFFRPAYEYAARTFRSWASVLGRFASRAAYILPRWFMWRHMGRVPLQVNVVHGIACRCIRCMLHNCARMHNSICMQFFLSARLIPHQKRFAP